MTHLSPAARVLVLTAAFMIGGALGIPAGEALGYGIASWLNRDPAEIKGTLLWCFALAPDLTWVFWTKLCEKVSLERSFGDAEEEVQRGADRGAAAPD